MCVCHIAIMISLKETTQNLKNASFGLTYSVYLCINHKYHSCMKSTLSICGHVSFFYILNGMNCQRAESIRKSVLKLCIRYFKCAQKQCV